MYNGVNDENNESGFNSDENLYHYSYSKDQAPQPGQPDPSQTSWQPAPRPEPQAAQEDQTSCTTGDDQDEPRIPKTNGKSFWKKTGTKVTALVLCCALVGGLCGFGGASLARKTGKTAIQETGRTASAVSVKSVDGQTLMSPAEVYAATVNSVVSINCSAVSTNIFGQKVESASSGSGFVITQDGYIVTNQHVVSGASSVNVTLYNGDTYPATVVGGDSDYDVAVLKIEATGLQAVTLGKSADVNVGDTVMAIGNPLGELTFSMSQGIVSCCDRAINVDGQVTDKAYMAIKAGSMTEQMAAQYNIDVTKGVFVYAVEKGGAGEKAGLQLGDVITKLNDTDITSMSDLSMAKKSYKAGDTVTLTVWRGGQEITLSLTFDQQPQTTGTEDDSSNQNQGQQDSYGDLYDYFFGRGNGGRGN